MLTSETRTRRSRRLASLLAFVVVAAIAAFAVRMMLVQRMRLPRLVLDQKSIVIGVATTPDGRTTFSSEDRFDTTRRLGDSNANIYLWNTQSGQLLRRLPGFWLRASGIVASPDGRHVIASGFPLGSTLRSPHESVTQWDWRTGQAQWSIPGDLPLCYSPDGSKVGIGGAIYDAGSGKLICRTGAKAAEDGQCRFTPDGKLYGIVNDTNTSVKTIQADEGKGPDFFYAHNRLHLWHADTGKEAYNFPFIRVRDFNFSRDGKWLVMVSLRGPIGGSDGSIVRRIDLGTGAAVWTYERTLNAPDNDSDADFNSVAISPNGKFVVLESTDTKLIVLDAATGQEVFRTLAPFQRSKNEWAIPGGLAFSADGRTLVSRGERGVLVWDARALL